MEIVATDISPEVIQKAERGVYGARSLRLVPPEVLARFFTPGERGPAGAASPARAGWSSGCTTCCRIRRRWAPFDVIFCRNVMIYFDKPTQRRLVDECFARVLDPRGYLFIGHSESLTGTSRCFHYRGD